MTSIIKNMMFHLSMTITIPVKSANLLLFDFNIKY